ncbi:MAG: DNA-3-methyladenine glycosylase 2 family protein [Clostridia bacterium]|nr:DNA-3-methyladenine glycosylase 2 family protein [Clostridia bacterium]
MSESIKKLVLNKITPLDDGLTLDCGQSFRWSENDDGTWHGVAFGKSVDVVVKGDELIITGDVCSEDEPLWREYFDLNTDYSTICKNLCSDKWLNKAISAYAGIRILKQEPWEALCSFIISQNNNIPRIKGIIERLCAEFGEKLPNGDFSFPSAEKLALETVESLAPLRAGFRAKYIIDAARKVADGTVDLEKINTMPIESARLELQKISGVGPKVAECTLLYGFGKKEAFPVDVWVRRIMGELYPDGLPQCTKGVEGIAQQYLFHWRRNVENPFEE